MDEFLKQKFQQQQEMRFIGLKLNIMFLINFS